MLLKVTKSAAKQIRESAAEHEDLALRVAATRNSDGGIGYRMGFDEIGADDVLLDAGGVDVVVARRDTTLLNGTVLDFVEIEPGRFDFIFMNPNDPGYQPPQS